MTIVVKCGKMCLELLEIFDGLKTQSKNGELKAGGLSNANN